MAPDLDHVGVVFPMHQMKAELFAQPQHFGIVC
jgi:hypothetical protein